MKLAFSVLVALVSVHPSTAMAVHREENVTQKYVLGHPDLISVTVTEKEKEKGLLSFKVNLKHKKSRHVVVHMKVRDDSRTLSENHTPMFTITEKSTYFFSIPREFIRTSTYSLSVGQVSGQEYDEPTPTVGGYVIYHLCLQDFASPDASEDISHCNVHRLVLPQPLIRQESQQKPSPIRKRP